MRKFDLNAAKAGAPVCTEGGLNARIICVDRNSEYNVVALIDHRGEFEEERTYTSAGEYDIHGCSCGDNLMMRDNDYAEKLARGEYGNHIVDVNKKVSPTCKESLPVDRECWRYKFAGQAMMGIFAGRNWPKDGAPDCIEHARNAVELADALIAELEKTEKKL